MVIDAPTGEPVAPWARIGPVGEPSPQSDSSWDHLAGAQVVSSHGWLRAVEAAGIEGLRAHYVSLKNHDTLAGAAVCYEVRSRRSGVDPTSYLLGRLAPLARGAGLSFLPTLVCAPYRGYAGHLLGPDRASVLDRVEALADELKLPICVPRVLDGDEDLCRLLLARGYHRTLHEPVACVDVVWDSFEAYLASLRHSARSAARGEIRRNREAGVEIREIRDPASCAARLHQLMDSHNERRNGAGVPFGPAFMPALKAGLGDRAVFYGAFRRGELVGVTFLFRQGDTAYVPLVGLDEDRGAFTYFNLVFYRPIADAITTGLRRVFFGTKLYEMKVRRGCRVLPTSLFYRGSSRAAHLAAAPLFRAHAWWVRRHKFARVLALRPPVQAV